MRKFNNCNRLSYLIMALVVMCLGLLSRRINAYIPDLMDIFLGDTLWALMVYFLIRVLFSNSTKKKAAFYGLLFCFAIELSQIYHSSWIDTIRNTTIGGLILGYGFLWSDLVSYLLGIVLGYFIDTSISEKR